MKTGMKSGITAVLFLAAVMPLILAGCFLQVSEGRMVSPVVRAAGIPDSSVVSSVALEITGPDMESVSAVYSGLPDVINISIPEGKNRLFRLTVNLDPSFTGVVTSYSGAAEADIDTDGTVVTIDMEIAGTKIIVPDAYNYRIVQLDDMKGNGWRTADWTDLGFSSSSSFIPYDIDTGAGGSILVANGADNGVDGGIYEISSIDYTSSLPPVPVYYAALDGNASVTAVSCDRKTGRVYGIAWGGVFYWDSPGDASGLTVSGYPSGLAVDSEGNLYVCGYVSSTANFPWIAKFSSSLTELSSYTGTSAGEINDVVVLDSKLYAAMSGTAEQLGMFDPDDIAAGPIAVYGTSGSEGVKGEFVGPHNFEAVLNSRLTIVDSKDYAAQLVALDDISGTNWETYGSWDADGGGTGVFKFFSIY